MIHLTEEDASVLIQVALQILDGIGATDIRRGIDESRREGIDEPVDALAIKKNAADLREIAKVRRRAPTDLEMLRIVFERLRERLIVVPAIARRLHEQFGTEDIVWRVDREFVSIDRRPLMEAEYRDLLPEGVETIGPAYEKIRVLVPDVVPPRGE